MSNPNKKKSGSIAGDLTMFDPAEYSLTLEEYMRRDAKEIINVKPRPREKGKD